MKDFVHLHVHTEYSLLDGACRINEMMEHVAGLGQKAVAITDHGVMYGVIDFYRAAKKAGIKPIIGCELYVAPRRMTDMTYELDSKAFHLVALCKNMQGYKNLIYLCSKGFTDGFYIKPRIDFELLQQHSEGLIILSACLQGEVQYYLSAGSYDLARDCAIKYRNLIGEGNYYLEMQDQGIPEEIKVNAELLKLSRELNIPLVATNDAHYISRNNSAMHDVMLCIQTGKTLSDPDRMKFFGEEFYLKSGDEMAALFDYVPEAIENTVKIADKCELEFTFGQYHLPEFKLPEGETGAKDYLQKLAFEGLSKRYEQPPEEYVARLEYELSTIHGMGFDEYFLIVWDFIKYAKDNGIPVGPGRGSGAGSLTAYSLQITDVDPMKFNLYFERFLNPERISMPDFDIDFCPNRRQEVIDYVTKKYGESHVAQIVTFGTMAARGAVRDVGRVMDMPYAEVDLIAKLIPFELKMTLARALEVSTDLKRFYENDPGVKKLIDMARQLEGMPRNMSTHAAGVIIAGEPVNHLVPIAKGDQGVVTQFTMNTLEELGLLKMDFLGLRNLTVIDDCVKEINSQGASVDLSRLDYEDQEVFAMLSKGNTAGVFQMESGGMTNVAMGLKPHSVEDITAIVALFRPGPMQNIPLFVERKNNPGKITYKHPLLVPILEVTYGVLVYQEQVMEVFRVLAGFSLSRADQVRKAMSKKKFDVLSAEKDNFVFGNKELGIKGCINNGVPQAVAESIFEEMLDFANYAFNKAHAVCYAVVAYQTAYLKYHYPRQYMSALLTSVLDNTGKIIEYIEHCRQLGIKVLPPDVNESKTTFTVAGEDIRFGIAAIKNVGTGLTKQLVTEREENGLFTDFGDFCKRMSRHDMNKRVLENLIKCGAFDNMGVKRSALMQVYSSVLDSCIEDNKKNIAGQIDLFSVAGDTGGDIILPEVQEYSRRELLSMEKESTGMYLSGHPLDDLMPLIKKANATTIARIYEGLESEDSKSIRDGEYITVAGMVTASKTKLTKKQTMMAYVTIEDVTSSIEALAFENVINTAGSYLHPDSAIITYGRISAREDEEPKLICDRIYPLTEEHVDIYLREKDTFSKGWRGYSDDDPKEADKPIETLWLQVSDKASQVLNTAFQILAEHPGIHPVGIYLLDTKKALKWDKGRVDISNGLLPELEALLSPENVKIK